MFLSSSLVGSFSGFLELSTLSITTCPCWGVHGGWSRMSSSTWTVKDGFAPTLSTGTVRWCFWGIYRKKEKRIKVRNFISICFVFYTMTMGCLNSSWFMAAKWKDMNNTCLCLITLDSVHFPAFWVFSLVVIGLVGGTCHSPVEGGRLLMPDIFSSSQYTVKPAFLELPDILE